MLREIERAAGRPFAEIGMTDVADDEPPSVSVLLGFQRAGRLWVAVSEKDLPIGYLAAAWVDGCAHVEQVSVLPDYARKGIGTALIDRLAGWAGERGADAVTLTTFTEVPWNGPYYRRCGFRELTDAELTPGLRAIRTAEAHRGLDRWPRTAMRLELDQRRRSL